MRQNRYSGSRFSTASNIQKKKIIDRTKIRNQYVGFYNQTVKESNPLTAFSNLSQCRIEIERKRDHLIERVEEFIEQIKKITKEEKGDSIEMEKAKFAVSQSMTPTFPYNLYLSNLDTDKETLINQLRRVYDLKKTHLNSSIIERVNKAYKNKEELEVLVTHIHSIERITGRILDLSYPEKLADFTKEEVEKEESKRGRKLDGRVPQDTIEMVVSELIQKAIDGVDGFKKFIHSSGRWKGRVNVNQIKEYIIEQEIIDFRHITDRGLIKRIKKALPDDMN